MILVNLESPVPLIDQIVKAIRYAIANGEVKPGEELPAVRQLAVDLGVNFNTVSRAYRVLESEGLVVTARGRGTRVVADRDSSAAGREGIPPAVAANLNAALADARLAGLGRKEIEAYLKGRIDKLWPRKK